MKLGENRDWEPMAAPAATVHVSDLVFSDQANHNFSKILGDLKRSNLSITNRLRSIREDAEYVQQVAEALGGRPLVANERCGSWYIRPDLKAASAYFKSTDGHTGQWKFSTRRLNLHLLPLISDHDGCVSSIITHPKDIWVILGRLAYAVCRCIIVDSTRRGKSKKGNSLERPNPIRGIYRAEIAIGMPDALSKTVPIWCCVLNRALFPDDPPCHELFVPPNVVSDSERSQMLARIPEHVESFLRLGLDLTPLRAQLKRPLRPMWLTPETHLAPAARGEAIFDDAHPVVCCTSSRRVVGAELSEAGYIQGAGDDTENWALGLTPPVFWAHAEQLLATPEAELPDLVRAVVAARGPNVSGETAPRQLTPRLFVMPSPVGETFAGAGETCRVVITAETTKADTWVRSPAHMEVGLGKHKVASRNLRQALPDIATFVSRFLNRCDDKDRVSEAGPASSQPRRVLVACTTGRDLSIGVALALLCRCFDDNDEIKPIPESRDEAFNKSIIKVKLGRIMTAMPEANPNRATLQSVNSFLMDWRG